MGYYQWRKEGDYETSTLLMQSMRLPLNNRKKPPRELLHQNLLNLLPKIPRKPHQNLNLCGPPFSKKVVSLSLSSIPPKDHQPVSPFPSHLESLSFICRESPSIKTSVLPLPNQLKETQAFKTHPTVFL